MATKKSSSDFGGGGRMKLKNLKTREDMWIVEEDYHTGVAASVPFMWETEPGTPKANFKEINEGLLISPLTPPPSYYFSATSPSPLPLPLPLSHNSNSNSKPYSSTTNFLNTVFRKLSVKATLQPLSLASLSSSSSSTSTTPTSSGRERGPKRLSFDSREDEDEEEDNVESPVSTLFFGRGGGRGGGATDKGCYPKLVKVFTRDSK